MKYAFEPGTREHDVGGAKVVVHAGCGVTMRQFEPVVRLWADFVEENAKADERRQED